MNDAVWDYIMLNGPMPKTAIETKTLEMMRNEFNYWYPVDCRVSGKDRRSLLAAKNTTLIVAIDYDEFAPCVKQESTIV